MYTFTPLCCIQVAIVHTRNNLLKALAATSWVQQKETIILTYHALHRSVIDYAAPVWAPVINSMIAHALRITTGCHKMSHTDQLHVETKLLPVKYHSELLAKQCWLSCFQTHHPCHLTALPVPARNMKDTLMKFNSEVMPVSEEGITDVDTIPVYIRRTLRSQAAVEENMNSEPTVLAASPSDISPVESLLNRSVHTTPAQL